MRRLLLLGSVFALGAGLLPASAASAQVAQASSIVATVAGTTEGGATCLPDDPADPTSGVDLANNLAPCDPTEPIDPDGKFNGVVLTGLFTAVDGTDAASCFADVEVTSGGGSVTFSEPNNVLIVHPDVNSKGTLGGAMFAGEDPSGEGVCTVNGSITAGGSYERVGNVAVAEFDAHFLVCTPLGCVWGWVTVDAVVSAIPGAGDPPGDPQSAQVEGVVAGECPPSSVPGFACAAAV